MNAVGVRPEETSEVDVEMDYGRTLLAIPLEEIHESSLNPRKHYDQQALEQLKDSLLASGQLTPIIVRPLKNGKGYELAAGHRRYRAARLAMEKHPEGASYNRLDRLLAIVRDLDDRTFIEILNIENLQRDDLHPLEEAQGFRDLMTHARYDVAKIAARTGRSEKYVYDRVKLLQLIPEAKKLFSAGAFEAGHAIILARLTPEQQEKALGDVEEAALGDRRASLLFRDQGGADAEIEELPLHDQIKPVTVREFQAAVQDSIRATPDAVDAFLFPESARLLEAAKEEKLSVIHITHDHRVSDDAKDEKIRTYGEQSWEFADGQEHVERYGGKKFRAKTCEFSRYGFVVAGDDQGQVFRVCVNKDKCHIHWPEQAKAAERRKKAVKKDVKVGGTSNQAKAAEKERQQEAKREAERQAVLDRQARWKKAAPELVSTLVKAVETMSVKSKVDMLLKRFRAQQWDKFAVQVQERIPAATQPLAKLVAYMLLEEISDYQPEEDFVSAFGEIGIKAKDVAKIVDEVAPAPTADVSTPGKKPKKAKVKK